MLFYHSLISNRGLNFFFVRGVNVTVRFIYIDASTVTLRFLHILICLILISDRCLKNIFLLPRHCRHKVYLYWYISCWYINIIKYNIYIDTSVTKNCLRPASAPLIFLGQVLFTSGGKTLRNQGDARYITILRKFLIFFVSTQKYNFCYWVTVWAKMKWRYRYWKFKDIFCKELYELLEMSDEGIAILSKF